MPHIGGVFLSSQDPKRLRQWFADALGIKMDEQGDGGMVAFPVGDSVAILSVQQARAGAPPPPGGQVEKEPYGRQPMMLNVRVEDLDGVIRRLRENKAEVAGPVDYEGFGRFAWTRTPDGHDVELWQP